MMIEDNYKYPIKGMKEIKKTIKMMDFDFEDIERAK